MHKISLRSNADIVAAAAGMVGFAPTDSVVAYLLRNDPEHGPLVRCAIRFDVTITREQATNFPRTCHLSAADNHAAILLAICDPNLDDHAGVILDALRDALETAGIPVIRRLLTRDITSSGEWVDRDTGERGPTYPYTDSLVTIHRVAHDGDRVSPSRRDIEREFDPTTPAPPLQVGDHGELVINTVEEIAQVLAGDRTASPHLATRAGIVITGHPALRDVMLQMALDHEQAATDLWTRIARQLRGRARCEALTIAAVCYCLINDAVRAGIALDAALDEAARLGVDPPRLATMLLDALQSGIHPSVVRRVVADAARRPDEG